MTDQNASTANAVQGQPVAVEAQQIVEQPKIKSVPWIMISGDQGVGKSTLAAAGTGGYCLDTEDRALMFDWKKTFSYGPLMYQELHGFVKMIGEKGKKTEEGIEIKDKLIKYLAIDTFDTLQSILMTRYIEQLRTKPSGSHPEIWAPTMEMKDWGVLLNYQKPLLADLKSLGIPIVICAHSKEIDPVYRFEKLQKPGKINFAISGAISGFIMNLVTYGLYVYSDETGNRKVKTGLGMIYDSYVQTTKDGGRLFAKTPEMNFKIKPDGSSDVQWIDRILAHHEYKPNEQK